MREPLFFLITSSVAAVRPCPIRRSFGIMIGVGTIEAFVPPLAFGAVALAVIMTALWWTVLAYKIELGDHAHDADARLTNQQQRSRLRSRDRML